MGKKVRWVFLLLLVFELVLLFTGVVPPHVAVVLVALTEGTALFLFLLIVVPTTIRIAKRVKTCARLTQAVQDEFRDLLPKPLLQLVKLELGLWASFVRGIRKKKDVPEESTSINYGREFWILCIALGCLAPVEVGAFELLFFYFKVPFAVHIIIWILSIYAMLWIVGMALSIRVYPHYANSNELIFRYCWYHAISIDPRCVEKVVLEKRECVKNKTIEYDDGLIALNDMRETKLSLYFKQPYKPIIDGELVNNEIMRFSFGADDPRAALKIIQNVVG